MYAFFIPTLLFVLLSPGLLVTLPPLAGKAICCSMRTSFAAIAVHAVIFGVAMVALRKYGVITEGFEVDKAAKDAVEGAPKPGPKNEGDGCEKAEECKMGLFCASKKCSKTPAA